MKRRVLVTGASGFIGSYIVEHFLKETDWDLVLIDNLSYATDVDGVIAKLNKFKNGFERGHRRKGTPTAPKEGDTHKPIDAFSLTATIRPGCPWFYGVD